MENVLVVMDENGPIKLVYRTKVHKSLKEKKLEVRGFWVLIYEHR